MLVVGNVICYKINEDSNYAHDKFVHLEFEILSNHITLFVIRESELPVHVE